MFEEETTGQVCALWRHLAVPMEDLLALRDQVWCGRQELSWGPRSELGGVMSAIEKHHPDVLWRDRIPKSPWTRDQFAAFMDTVRRSAPRGSSFRARWRVAEVLDAGNRLGVWKIPLYDIPAPLPPPGRPVFRPERFERMVQYEPLHARFVEAVGADVGYLDDGRMAWGQILGSFLLYGGLVQPAWLGAVPHSLGNAPAHLHWLDIERSLPDNQRPVIRRHYLDPITRSVVKYWKERGWPKMPASKERGPAFLKRLIGSYFRRLDPSLPFPDNWTDLRDVVETRLALYIPPHLIGYATGFYNPVSLPPEVMQRIEFPPAALPYGDGLAVTEPKGIVPAEPQGMAEDRDADDTLSTPPVGPWIRELGRSIRGGSTADPKRVSTWLERHADRGNDVHSPLPPSIIRMGEWAQHWLLASRGGSGPMKPKTAYDRFNALAIPLAGFLSDEDPATFESADDFIEVYTAVLETADTLSKRKRLAAAIASFHEFMRSAHKAPEVASAGLFTVHGRQPHAVDANFIEPRAFEWAVRWLDYRYAEDPALRETLVLIPCLGYFAGLRRSEAVGLLIDDLDGEPAWDCVVSPNRNRGLKSSSAHRVIPLGVLLPERYLERLKHWWATRRQTVIADGGDPAQISMFDRPRKKEADNDNLRRFDRDLEQITDALIRVTGDAGLRYHHLRHSFANQLLLALWRHEHADDALVVDRIDPLIGFEDVATLRTTLLGNSPVQRRSLRLISALMGHLTTEITMNHYIHLTDLLWGQAVREALPRLELQDVARLLGVSIKHVQRSKRNFDIGNPVVLLEKMLDQHLGTPVPADTDAGEPKQLLPPRDPHAALLSLTDYLNSPSEDHPKDAQFLPPWDCSDIEAVREWIAALPEHFRQPPTGTTERVIAPPRTQQGRRLSKATIQILQFGETPWSATQRDQLTRLFRSHKLASGPLNVVVPTVSMLKLWWRFLHELQLDQAFDFVHFSALGGGRESPMGQYQYWARHTPVELESGDARREELKGIEPTSRRGLVLVRHRGSGEAARNARWVYGVCWALTMLAALKETPRCSLTIE
ncbi:site-specific integrase [Thioalkalivibrio sp. ALgr3]|uniref:site-specific integrase n=1 Tax=Thioalkalivibrio sp. ALgr3 TaxID=1239292 RepID=UPI0003A101D9|nr:site-specific integrase [Thioalkalivibrio sp. ALgr3]